MPKKKKASGKKKTESKKSKDLSDDALKPIMKSPEETLFECCKLLRWWLNEECAKVDTYFNNILETEDQRTMSVDEFILALKYLQVPISSHQIDLLMKYLDSTKNGFVDLMKFKELRKLSDDQQLLKISQTTSLVDEESDATLEKGKKKKGKHSVEQVMKDSEYHMEIAPRYVKLKLLLGTFRHYEKHPGHFTVCLTTTTTIHGVSKLIQEHFKNGITSVAIFTGPSCSKESYLSPSRTLESCGIRGSLVQHDPSTHQLYYDYIPDFIDCPLLMTDISMRHIVM